jgi:SnoaL-like domain
VSAESAELADAVRRVTDELAMQRVMVNYARGSDRRNWDLVRSCFTADAFVHGTSF